MNSERIFPRVGLLLALLVLGLTACYAPQATDCRIRCGERGSCPQGLVCSSSLCARPGHACPAEPGDGPEPIAVERTAKDAGPPDQREHDTGEDAADVPAPVDRVADAAVPDVPAVICEGERVARGGRCECREGMVDCLGRCIPFGGDGRTRVLCTASSTIAGDPPSNLCELLATNRLIQNCPPDSPEVLGPECKRQNGINTMTYTVHELSIDRPQSWVSVRHFCCMDCKAVPEAQSTCDPRPGAERRIKDCTKEL